MFFLLKMFLFPSTFRLPLFLFRPKSFFLHSKRSYFELFFTFRSSSSNDKPDNDFKRQPNEQTQGWSVPLPPRYDESRTRWEKERSTQNQANYSLFFSETFLNSNAKKQGKLESRDPLSSLVSSSSWSDDQSRGQMRKRRKRMRRRVATSMYIRWP